MEIEPGLRVVTAPNPGIMTGDGTNQYLLGRDRLTMIDAALGAGTNLDRIRGELDEAGAEVETILLTHIHPDHLGGAVELAGVFGARLGMHVSRRGYAGTEPDFVYDDGDRLAYDGGFLEVIHTPGHESGHCCFFEPSRHWLFTGDHVVGAGTVVIAPPDGDMGAYLDSLRRLLEIPATLLCGGHGPPLSDPKAKIQEYLDHRLDREREVLEAVRSGRTQIPEVVSLIYRDVPAVLHPAAAMSVDAHLSKLVREGRVRRHGEEFSIIE